MRTAAIGLGLLWVLGCDSKEDEAAGGSVGAGASGSTLPGTGAPCEKSEECYTQFCITNESFKSLSDGKEGNIPGGYCSRILCDILIDPLEECGPSAECFDIQAYTDTNMAVCLATCESASDCREGYECTDGSAAEDVPPFPKKVCLPPDLLCLLDIPNAACPAEGSGGSDGMGGSGGSTSTGGAGGH